MEIVKINNVSFGYSPQNFIIKNINITINEGEFLCIVGENGSGKSTLMKCILGLNKVTEGNVEIDGRIGYLPQVTEIQNNFPATIQEVILSGTIPNNIKKLWYTKNDKQKAKEIMEKLELYDIRKRCFSELSGGQKQRVLIARALCSTEKIIVLDEPVNGLDPKIVTQIYKILKTLNKEKKLTVIMVSHDIDRAIKYCTRIIEIGNGKVVRDLTPSEYKERREE